MSISIIIPVYHEEKNIKKVLNEIDKKVKTKHEILVIYDYKDDPTYKVLLNTKTPKFTLIKNNQGSGTGVMNAIKTGFKKARGQAIVVVMADLSDDLSQIDQMYKLIKKSYDIVCASRYMPGGKKIGGPIIKTLLSKFAGLSLYYIFKIPTHDATNAFKMYKRSIFKKIIIESTGGFEYSLEIILKAFKKGFRITEIPTIWKDREAGKSNFKMFKWLPSYVKWYIKIFN